jgi:hypothetical protein
VRGPLEEEVHDWRAFLEDGLDADDSRLRDHTRTGWPLGGEAFLDELEERLGRPARPKKRRSRLR